MSQALLRRCIQSSRTVQHHRRWLAQQALTRDASDDPQEPTNGTEPTSSAAQPVTIPVVSSSHPTPASNREGGHRVDVFLASLQTTGSQPSLEDLERGRPRQYAHPESTLYAKQYNEILEQLDRSFTKEQLRRFAEKYQLDSWLWRSHRRKADYGRAIVENAWGWPSLRDIERKKREKTEIVTETFKLSRSQLFLILGKDGSDLLRLANDFSVKISMIPKPLALEVQGIRSSLERISERIGALKRSVVEEIVHYDGSEPLSKEYIVRISKLSSAFIESVGDKFRICAADPRNLSAAKRLITRAAHHLRERPGVPLLSHIPPLRPTKSLGYSTEEECYSMYPFVSHTPLPWTAGGSSVFRIRKLSDWLTQNSTVGVGEIGGLSSGSVLNTLQESISLRGALLDALPEERSNRIRTCTASIGHIVFSHPDGRKTTLAPPMKGHGPYSKILNWIQSEHPRSEFASSIPPSLATPPNSDFQNFHRLTYRAPGTLVSPLLSPEVLKLEIPLETRNVEPDVDVANADTKHLLQTSETPQMWAGYQSEVEVLMPHRPVDIRISVQDFSLGPGAALPLVLQQYVTELNSYLQNQDSGEMEQPVPPAFVRFQGVSYELHSTESVRRNLNPSGDEELGVVTETILDLETSQKSSVCLVNGGSPMEDEEWDKFLSQCNKVATFRHRPTGSLALDGPVTNDVNTT